MKKTNLYICKLVLLFLCTYSSIAQTTPDPGLPGPLAVTKAYYDLGDLAFTSSSFPFPMELRGSVHYPTGLASGPYPVLVFLHGRHSTCYQISNPDNTNSNWPCSSGWQPIVSFEGYDYLARQMASHGYIVISISCNAINADDAASNSYGMYARGALVQRHLDLWKNWNTTGGTPFGSIFIGKLDMQNIGTMGHSRGGEGVVFNALLNDSLGKPYGIKAVLTLAPVDFKRKKLNNIPLMNLAPYCDGDVSNQQGVHFYDDVRYTDSTDEAPKHNVVFMGANHNFFNTVWTPFSYVAGGSDDWDDIMGDTDPYCGTGTSTNKRFDTTKQMKGLNTYLSAFFRVYIGHEIQFAPILNVTDVIPPASSTLDTTNVFMSYHPGRTDRIDINRTDTVLTITTNTMGAAVTTGTLATYGICGGGFTETTCFTTGVFAAQEPHKGTNTQRGLSQVRMKWNDTADFYQNIIPAAWQDLTYVQSLQFRAVEDFTQVSTGVHLNFSVVLIDSVGDSSSLQVRDYSHAMFRTAGTEPTILPKLLFNTISIPIEDFTGINLAKVRKVKFKFNKSATGTMLISDLAFVNERCGRLNAVYTSVAGTGTNVTFTNGTVANAFDTVTRLWSFGDPSSGLNDTSTLINPTHHYVTIGAHTACLYIKSVRRNGSVCLDTFCTTITTTIPALVSNEPEMAITIMPNPAKDYLIIDGAQKTDVLKLINLYGQEVLSTAVTDRIVNLPQSIANGVYYAIVVTRKGNIYKKLVIYR